jgi:hypothetical protein
MPWHIYRPLRSRCCLTTTAWPFAYSFGSSFQGWVVPNFTFHFITFQFIIHFKFHAPVGPTARSEMTAKRAFRPAKQQLLAS